MDALVCYLGNEGLSPASKASLNCLTALSWPGRRKMPSSFSPCSLMNSTHFCTRIGTMWGPKRCSYVIVSMRLFPNTEERQNGTLVNTATFYVSRKRNGRNWFVDDHDSTQPPLVGAPMTLRRVRTHSSMSLWEFAMNTYGYRSLSPVEPERRHRKLQIEVPQHVKPAQRFPEQLGSVIISNMLHTSGKHMPERDP